MSVNLSQSDLDYIAIAVAHKLADLLRHPDEDWLSQNKAWKRYGGRSSNVYAMRARFAPARTGTGLNIT